MNFSGWFYHFFRFAKVRYVRLFLRHVNTFYTLNYFVKALSSVQLVLSLHRGTGVHQQLHQPSHLRRQVPRVPAGRQTSDDEAETEQPAGSSFSDHLR